MHHKGEGNMVLIPHLYPAVYPQVPPPQQGETRPRRRRKKSSKGSSAGSGEAAGSGGKKRKLSAEQVNLLEMSFGDEHKLESERKDRLASELGLDPRQVAVWFQNRRARWKNKKLEEEYNKLKSVHDSVVVEKCRLESEMLTLKEQLLEAKKEIQRLAKHIESGQGQSPMNSSVSMEGNFEAPFLSDFGVDTAAAYDNLFYMSENPYMQGMEWMDLYM